MLARTLTERITENYPQGVPVQLPRPSVGQYVLGPLLNHDALYQRH